MGKQAVTPPKSAIKQDHSIKVTFSWLESPYLGWILAGLYFFIMIITSFSFHKIGDYGVETDFFWSYVPQAQSFMNGDIIIDKYRGPLYPITLGVINTLFGNFFKTGVFIAVLSASLVIFFIFNLFKQLFGNIPAFVAVILVAVNTTFNLYTYSAGTDMFFNFICTASLYFLLRKQETDWKSLVFAGLFAGLAYITRYNGIFLLVTALTCILFFNIYKLPWVKRIVSTAIFLGVFVIIIAPWGIYTAKEKGKAFWNENYQNIAYEYLAKDKMSWDQFWYQGNRDKFTSLTQVIFSEPKAFFSQFTKNIFDHIGKDLNSLIGWHLGIFAIIGLLLFFYNVPNRNQWGYYLASVLFFGVLLLVFYSERFSLFLIPFYTILAVSVFFKPNKYITEKIIHNKAYLVFVSAILAIITFSKSYSYNSENINCGDKNLPKIAKEFHNVEGKKVEGKIYSRKAHIAYYLGLKKQEMPQHNTYYEFVTNLWKNDVKYVSYGIWEMGRGLDFLKDLENLPPDFTLVAMTQVKNKMVFPKEGSKSPYKIDVDKQEQPALIFKIKIDSNRISMMDAIKWIEKTTPKDKQKQLRIMAGSPYISSWFGAKEYMMPRGDINQLHQAIQVDSIDYLFYGLYEASASMMTSGLISGKQFPEWLEPVMTINQQSSCPAVLYKIKK